MPLRRSALLSAGLAGLCLALGAAGCGDDEDEPGGTATTTAPDATETETAPADTETTPETETETEPVEVPPEDQPGGAGDEEEIRSEAKLVGRGGRVNPPQVSVPPFIGVRVQLRSADGETYALSCNGRRVQADAEIETASTTIPGQRPGRTVSCRALESHNDVRISFSAEPGP
jgi:hypothetical protein